MPRDLVVGLAGWMPTAEVAPLADRLGPLGAAVAPLPTPRGVDPPTLVHTRGRLNRSFAPLMDTYATVPYVDLDPTVVAGLAFVVMYGMMFADAGQGALLVLGGLLLRAGRPRRLARFRTAWPFLLGAGISATVFGVLFGEFFGPTGVLPVLWVKPLEEPVLLLEVAIGVGACLLSGAYAIGTVNRWREGGLAARRRRPVRPGRGGPLPRARPALARRLPARQLAGGRGRGGRRGRPGAGVRRAARSAPAGAAPAPPRRASSCSTASSGSAPTWCRSPGSPPSGWPMPRSARSSGRAPPGCGPRAACLYLAAVALFVVGNALTFTLQAVVAGVQALRLEYYELFSRVFVVRGPALPALVPSRITPERVP